MTTFIAGQYHIESHGNGWAYSITDQRTGDNLWFQDADADAIQDATNDFDYPEALDQYFECIEQ
tara:strand:- start:3823 stop:4014 length:192 start_codon:yes stop_codon:yes gene_type:complete